MHELIGYYTFSVQMKSDMGKWRIEWDEEIDPLTDYLVP